MKSFFSNQKLDDVIILTFYIFYKLFLKKKTTPWIFCCCCLFQSWNHAKMTFHDAESQIFFSFMALFVWFYVHDFLYSILRIILVKFWALKTSGSPLCNFWTRKLFLIKLWRDINMFLTSHELNGFIENGLTLSQPQMLSDDVCIYYM